MLTKSKCLQLNCYQIQQLLAIVKNSMVNKKHCFENAEGFHLLHFTYPLRYYIIIIIKHRWNLLTFSRANIKLYCLCSKQTSQSKLIHLQKLANRSVLNDVLVIEIVSNTFSESNKNFGRLVVKNMFPLDFIKYLRYSEVQSLF